MILKLLITLIAKYAIFLLIKCALHAILLGLQIYKFKYILIISMSCSQPNFNYCTSCDISGTYRDDFHLINGTCPC